MRSKIYNAGAYGIPAALIEDVSSLGPIPLRYSRHSMQEALNDRYGTLPGRAFPTAFLASDHWSLVEVESSVPGEAEKFVVRRPVDDRRSLVLVIQRDGFVRTLWTNLNTDGHATLNLERFDKP